MANQERGAKSAQIRFKAELHELSDESPCAVDASSASQVALPASHLCRGTPQFTILPPRFRFCFSCSPAHAPHSSLLTLPRAFTLLELLLVLALLVVIAGLAMPMFEGSFTTLRLRRGTDQVLSAWVRVRTAAIESGRPHQFRFQTDSGEYLVEPWPRDEEFSITQPNDGDTSRKGFLETRRIDGAILIRDQLPEGIVLKRGERAIYRSSQSEPTRLDVKSLTTGNSATGPYGMGWSAPILFHPDGTALDVSLLLSNGQRQYQRASLRGLTGTGHASKIISASELDR